MKLLLPVFLNIIFAVVFYLLENHTPFKKMNYWLRQIIIGICFGSVAIVASHFGLQVENTIANVRDSSPLLAGFIFGAPSGVIAGVIGGIYRFVSVAWGAGKYTQISCSVAVILAGIVAGVLRKLMFDNKKPSPMYAAGSAAVCEIVHMLLIFFTNMDDVVRAFDFVKAATLPMVIGNAVTVGVAMFIIKLIGRNKKENNKGKKLLAQTFQRWLLLCILIAFALTGYFTYQMQSNMAEIKSKTEIETTIEDIHNNIVYASNQNLLGLAHNVAEDYNKNPSNDKDSLLEIAEDNHVDEINIIDKNGIVIASTDDDIVGFDMYSGAQSGEFTVLLNGAKEYVQLYQQVSRVSNVSRKYAGIALDEGFIQVGYIPETFHQNLRKIVIDSTKNRHIGEEGWVAICDMDWNLVIDTEYSGVNVSEIGINIDTGKMKINTVYEADITTMFDSENAISHMYAYDFAEGYIIIGAIPTEEALFMRNASIYVSLFMEVIIFVALFVLVYFLIKKLIINNLIKINNSLSKITQGNLNVTVDVRSNMEFASLSDDINSTVDTLKRYIAEASARIDKELNYAKEIQLSALPSKFPPFPENKNFDIYAQMIAAKEVGGDFYDFYMLDKNKVAFLCADVSGKGIPAAMFMMQAKTIIKSLAERGLPVNEIFTLANEKLCENNESGMFVTAWMGVLDLETGVLQFANAGHNPPLLLHNNGEFEYLKSRAGFVLAGMEGIKYRLNELQLCKSDRIFLYTDGVTEATDTDDKLYGEQRLIDFMNNHKTLAARELLPELKNSIDSFVGEAPQFDDITMLILDYNHMNGDGDMKTAVFSAEDSSLPEVIGFVESELEKMNCSPKNTMQICVAIEEIFVNIAHYAYGEAKGDATLKIGFDEASRTATFILSDKGAEFDPLKKADPDVTLSAQDREIGGLGIFITKKTMDSVSYRYENGENILTMQKII